MTRKMGTIVTLTLVLLLLPASLAQQNQPEQSAPETQQQQPYSQSQPTSFTGTIVKNSNKLVLKTEAGETYQLDDQQQAKRFEGKAVTITGSVDGKAKKMTIHVESIQPSTQRSCEVVLGEGLGGGPSPRVVRQTEIADPCKVELR